MILGHLTHIASYLYVTNQGYINSFGKINTLEQNIILLFLTQMVINYLFVKN